MNSETPLLRYFFYLLHILVTMVKFEIFWTHIYPWWLKYTTQNIIFISGNCTHQANQVDGYISSVYENFVRHAIIQGGM